MKALLFFTLVLACLAERNPPCPEGGTPPGEGGASAVTSVRAFYKYSYEIPKDGANNQLHIYLDIDDPIREQQTLWMRVTSDSANANTVDLNIKINVDQQSPETDPNWFNGDLTDGDDSRTITTATLDYNSTSRIYFDFYPDDCSVCSESIDFSVEIAWLTSSTPFVWAPALMVDNIRTIVFDQVEGANVTFYADFAANQELYVSLVYPGTLDQSSQIVLYWQKDTPALLPDGYDDKYPFDAPVDGDYDNFVRPFVADTAGTWWLTTYVLTQGGTADPKFTIKVGFDEEPCAGAFTLTASSFLLALIPLTLLFSRQ